MAPNRFIGLFLRSARLIFPLEGFHALATTKDNRPRNEFPVGAPFIGIDDERFALLNLRHREKAVKEVNANTRPEPAEVF